MVLNASNEGKPYSLIDINYTPVIHRTADRSVTHANAYFSYYNVYVLSYEIKQHKMKIYYMLAVVSINITIMTINNQARKHTIAIDPYSFQCKTSVQTNFLVHCSTSVVTPDHSCAFLSVMVLQETGF